MKKEIFKAYDIRGIYPTEINEDDINRIGRAYVKFLTKEWNGADGKSVVVGCDVRNSSPALKTALIEGITSQGVNVIDIGIISTDMLYFASATLEVDGGITVSASHNPAEFNGMKMVRKGAVGISGDTGLNEIATLALSSEEFTPSATPGTVKKVDIRLEYIAFIRKFIDFNNLSKVNKKLRILINANFGPAGSIAQELVEGLPVELIKINCELSGDFPLGPPNPMLEANREMMAKAIISDRVDLGVAWDADADRVFFYTSSGVAIEGYFIGSLLAKIVLDGHRGEKVIHDPRLVWANIEAIEASGGAPIIHKTGHMFIKEAMRKHNAIFATEMSAHYYFRDFFYADNGMIPFLLIISQILSSGKTIDQLVEPWTSKYFTPGEINFKTEKAINIIESAETKFGNDGKITKIDGLSVEFKDWRFNLRTSNTEALLRLNIEATSKELMQEKLKILTDYINSF